MDAQARFDQLSKDPELQCTVFPPLDGRAAFKIEARIHWQGHWTVSGWGKTKEEAVANVMKRYDAKTGVST